MRRKPITFLLDIIFWTILVLCILGFIWTWAR